MIKKSEKKEKTQQKSKNKKIFNIISTVLLAVVFLFLIFVIAVAIVQKKAGSDVKLFEKYYMYSVVTDSMEPTIMAGEVIWSRAATESDIKEGAIITFIAPSGNLKGYNETHRIKTIERDENNIIIGIKTKGDNSQGEDNWTLQPPDVKAVYVKSLTVMSAFRTFMAKPAGFITVIVLPLLVVLILFMIGFVKDKVKLDEEERKEKEGNKATSLDELTDEQKKALAEQIIAKQAAEALQAKAEENEKIDVEEKKDIE